MKIAVIGNGSIGKRHVANLKALDIEPVVADIGDELPVHDIQGAMICTPTATHVDLAMRYAFDSIPTFIEKPLGWYKDLGKLEELVVRSHKSSMVACNLHFHPDLPKIWETLHYGSKVLWARAEFSYDLRKWKPTDYRKSYSAGESGGILLDSIHEPTLLAAIFGMPIEVNMSVGKFSRLDISQEDTAEMVMLHPGGIVTSAHISYNSLAYHRKLYVKTEKDFAQIDLPPNDEMYVRELKEWIDNIRFGLPTQSGKGRLSEAAELLTKLLDAKDRYVNSVQRVLQSVS